MSKYASVIKEARKSDNQNPIPPTPTEGPDPQVNLSIKVSKSLRRHWVAEAKRHDTTITAAIIEALKAKFGEP